MCSIFPRLQLGKILYTLMQYLAVLTANPCNKVYIWHIWSNSSHRMKLTVAREPLTVHPWGSATLPVLTTVACLWLSTSSLSKEREAVLLLPLPLVSSTGGRAPASVRTSRSRVTRSPAPLPLPRERHRGQEVRVSSQKVGQRQAGEY